LGDEAAFELLAVELGPRLFRFLMARLGDERDARDALQETLIACWQRLRRLREPDKVWPWLAGIAAHKAADVLRQRRRRSREQPLEHLPTESEGDRPSPQLAGALAELPAPLRDVLLLRYLLQLSERETAEALGLRLGTVKSRSARGRERLEQLLQRGTSRVSSTAPTSRTGP